jgi:hypothetical protein
MRSFKITPRRTFILMRWMCVGVAAAFTVSVASSGQTIEVHLESSSEQPTKVIMRAVDGDGAEVIAEGTAPGIVEIDIEPSKIWTFGAEGASRWAPPQTIFVNPGDRRIHLDVLDAATVSGRLIAHPGERAPNEVLFTASPAISARGCELPSRWERWCAIDDEGGFKCQLPTGDLNLKLRAPTYLSHFRWGLELGRDGFEWGDVRLVPGASVVVCVVDRGDETLPNATVDLVFLGGMAHENGRPDKIHRAITNGAGVAVVNRVTPGYWMARASKTGKASSETPPFRVLARTEVSLSDPLILDESTTLSIVVTPPATPRGEAWVIEGRQAGQSAPGSALAPSRSTDPGGWAHWESVPRRRMALRVSDADGGLWHTGEVDLATELQPIRVHLDAIRVHGRVEEPSPVSGTLVWRVRPGHGDVRTAYSSITAGGKYEVNLSADGQWLVAIQGPDGGLSETVAIDIPRPEFDEPVPINLIFPSSGVSGRVVDHEGLAVAGAMVSAAPAKAGALEEIGAVPTALTDHEGAFEIRSNTGEFMLTARGPDGASATVSVTVGSDASRSVEIRLPEPKLLRGRVLLEGRPAPGVTIITLPISGGPARLEPHYTDIAGRFEILLSSPGPLALIAIPSRGGAQIQVESPRDEEVVVNLSALFGQVEALWNPVPGVRPVLRVGPAFVGLEFFVMFAPAGGGFSGPGRVVVQNLACGRYELCIPRPPGQAATPQCRSLNVVPGGHTVVDMTEAE